MAFGGISRALANWALTTSHDDACAAQSSSRSADTASDGGRSPKSPIGPPESGATADRSLSELPDHVIQAHVLPRLDANSARNLASTGRSYRQIFRTTRTRVTLDLADTQAERRQSIRQLKNYPNLTHVEIKGRCTD